MSDRPRSYDREYETTVARRVRKRLGYDRSGRSITRFVVQLEYVIDDEWQPVVRYDHDAIGEFGHDVSDEGIHVDVFRDGEKYRTEFIAPPLPATRALDLAEDHFATHLEAFIRRFESCQEIERQG